MKYGDGEYCGFEKDVDVDEDVDWNISEKYADMRDQYIGSELQLPKTDEMKWT